MKRKAAKPAVRKPKTKSSRASRTIALLVATRKGAWLLHSDAARKNWRTDGPHFLGHIVSHMVLDPRDGHTLLAATKTGHLGPTLMRSTDRGRTWQEAKQPPAFAKVPEGEKGRAVDHTFWLTPGHRDEPNVWYAGTSPQGLFRSSDGGVTWQPFSMINDDMTYRKWMGTAQDGTPDGPKLHSIIIDPRDRRHMLFGMSGGGVHESKDGGKTWQVIINGMEVVQGYNLDPKIPTFHDPHCVRICPSNPDRLYQQNHCGIYRRDGNGAWERIGRSMPKTVGDIGFPLVVHRAQSARNLCGGNRAVCIGGRRFDESVDPGRVAFVHGPRRGRGARRDGRRRSRRAGTTVSRDPLSHDRRAGPHPPPHPFVRQRRAGARDFTAVECAG